VSEYTVALWYMRYGSPDYDLCETEQEAAAMAVYMVDDGRASVSGVQFADGRLVPIRDWQAYHDEARRRHAAEKAERDECASRPPAPSREALDPFERRRVKIEASEPAWLGLRPAGRQAP
jgi:hypothetical protein